jgi:hypothetical protein
MLKFAITATLQGADVERNNVWRATSLRGGNIDAKDVAVSVKGENSKRIEKSAKNLGGVGGVAENAGDFDDFEEKEAGGVGGVEETTRESEICLGNGADGPGGVGESCQLSVVRVEDIEVVDGLASAGSVQVRISRGETKRRGRGEVGQIEKCKVQNTKCKLKGTLIGADGERNVMEGAAREGIEPNSAKAASNSHPMSIPAALAAEWLRDIWLLISTRCYCFSLRAARPARRSVGLSTNGPSRRCRPVPAIHK